ncbi:hypothetical protein GCM10018779_67140 [Streptomyces griseocarneus]|nr:hypothetical protein GCM10018779_67140 [Streptomyces griseocarneus]
MESGGGAYRDNPTCAEGDELLGDERGGRGAEPEAAAHRHEVALPLEQLQVSSHPSLQRAAAVAEADMAPEGALIPLGIREVTPPHVYINTGAK